MARRLSLSTAVTYAVSLCVSIPEALRFFCCVQAMLLRRLADVASGLCYLHSRNVCHGDLKCENVLLRTGREIAGLTLS